LHGCSVFEIWEAGVYWCNDAQPRLVELANESADAVQLAAEVGRLDVVTLLLGLFGLLLASAALGWFSLLWRHATRTAKIAAETETKKRIEEYVIKEARPVVARTVMTWMQDQKDTILDTYGDESGDIQELMNSLERDGK
jgi:hypothetical protein